MRRSLSRLVNLFRRGGAERELAREIQAHLALLAEDFERQGMPPAQAALAARRAYGGIEQAKELHREARSFLWMEQVLKDLRYGWSNLMRNPGFTFTAVVALALAIGANISLFVIYDAIILKQLPVADAGHVVRLKRWFEHNSSGNIQFNFAYAEYQYLRDHVSSFSALALSTFELPVLASVAGGPPEHLRGHAVSANYFAALGVNPRIGRTFFPDEDRTPGGDAVVVLSYEFWQRKYGGDPKVSGQTIKLNDVAYTIVGVTPQEFTGTDVIPTESAFWAPVSMVQQLGPGLNPLLDHWYPATQIGFQLLARVKGGVSRSEAQAETNLALRRYLGGQHETERTTALTLQRTSYFDDTEFLAGLAQLKRLGMIMACMVLFAACANIANMLVARGATRQREIGIRLALGASRFRIVRQLLTESILLALVGGAVAIPFATWTGRLLWISLNRGLQLFGTHVSDLDFRPDASLFAYGAAVSLLTGVLFGLAPALQATRQDLRERARATAPRSRLRPILLASQVAIAAMLVSGVGELSSAALVRASDQGFDARHTYLLNIHDDDQMGVNRRVRDRLAILPELNRVAIGGWPLQGNSFFSPLTTGSLSRPALVTYESDGYFETMGIPLLQGHGFTRSEADHGAPVAVVSASTAKHYWPGRNPLGQRFSLGVISTENGGSHVSWEDRFKEYEVVGVARDIRFRDVAVNDPSHVYLPLAALTQGNINGGVVFRIGPDRERALAAVHSAVESVDQRLLADMQVMSFEEGPISTQRDVDRLVVSVVGIILFISLALAGVGIYGVVAFLVSQRTQEIGIRIALGAASRTVIRAILKQGLKPAFFGIAIGFAVSAAISVWERSQEAFPDTLLHSLFGDPWMYAGLCLLLALATLAGILPARRASRVDPIIALRCE
ncbi:MAG TPA: ABC transporter permease [Bryobacteraceae bacterium]|jgi:predicted permease